MIGLLLIDWYFNGKENSWTNLQHKLVRIHNGVQVGLSCKCSSFIFSFQTHLNTVEIAFWWGKLALVNYLARAIDSQVDGFKNSSESSRSKLPQRLVETGTSEKNSETWAWIAYKHTREQRYILSHIPTVFWILKKKILRHKSRRISMTQGLHLLWFKVLLR